MTLIIINEINQTVENKRMLSISCYVRVSFASFVSVWYFVEKTLTVSQITTKIIYKIKGKLDLFTLSVIHMITDMYR